MVFKDIGVSASDIQNIASEIRPNDFVPPSGKRAAEKCHDMIPVEFQT